MSPRLRDEAAAKGEVECRGVDASLHPTAAVRDESHNTLLPPLTIIIGLRGERRRLQWRGCRKRQRAADISCACGLVQRVGAEVALEGLGLRGPAFRKLVVSGAHV